MTTTYAKPDKLGALEFLHRIPHISNCTPERLAAYARTHGYKQVHYSPPPAPHTTCRWEETEDALVQRWDFPPLPEYREQAMQEIQQWRNNALASTRRLERAPGWPIEYTQEAVTLVQGALMLLLIGQAESCSWTDADNIRHDNLGPEDMQAIASALAGHIQGIQDKADATRTAIRTASTVEEISAALHSLT